MTHRILPSLRSLAPLALLAAAAGVTACDRVLQTEPYDRVPAEQQIVDAATAQASLVGVYDALQSGGSGSYYDLDIEMLGDLPTDNGACAGTYQFICDLANGKVAADNPEVSSLWTGIYITIDRANTVIQRVPQVSGIPDATAKEILGQAYFIRALSYHNLVKLWGDVPMPLTPVKVASDAAKYTRTPAAQVYAQILSDLDEAGKRVANTSDTRRVTVNAVKALRARVLFYRASLAGSAGGAADYQGALDAANAVLALKGDTLTVPFANLFTATGDNTAEDIFRVSYTAAEANNLGYYWLYAGRHEAAPSTNLNNAYDSIDVRKAVTVRTRSSTSSRLQGTKWPTTAGTEHPHVIRLAELVLIKAEVLARQNKLVEAVDEYNKVRIRAGLAKHVLGVNVTTQADVLAAIDKERRLELALEGDRFPDLVRTGRVAAVKPLNDKGATLFPIPLREMRTTPGLTQNAGY